MIQKIKKALIAFMALAALATPALVPATVGAADDIEKGLCAGARLDPTNTTCDPASDEAANTKIKDIVTVVLNLLSLLVGIVAVIMIIIGGLRFILSGGDSSNVTSSRNTILYAIVGLVVVALAQFVVRFVLTKVV